MLTIAPDCAVRWDVDFGREGEGDGIAIVG